MACSSNDEYYCGKYIIAAYNARNDDELLFVVDNAEAFAMEVHIELKTAWKALRKAYTQSAIIKCGPTLMRLFFVPVDKAEERSGV